MTIEISDEVLGDLRLTVSRIITELERVAEILEFIPREIDPEVVAETQRLMATEEIVAQALISKKGLAAASLAAQSPMLKHLKERQEVRS